MFVFFFFVLFDCFIDIVHGFSIIFGIDIILCIKSIEFSLFFSRKFFVLGDGVKDGKRFYLVIGILIGAREPKMSFEEGWFVGK